MATNNIERDAIRNTQRYLRHLSFHNEELGNPPVDGIWDDATRLSLIAFQKQQGLPPTGTVDPVTWERLREEYLRSIAENSPPAMLKVFPRIPEGFLIKAGDRGFPVDAVQYILSELERLYYFPNYTPSGVYDDATMALVTDFQRRNGIFATGNVDRETWDALAVQHNLLFDRSE